MLVNKGAKRQSFEILLLRHMVVKRRILQRKLFYLEFELNTELVLELPLGKPR